MVKELGCVKIGDDALRLAHRLSGKGFYASAVSFLRVAEREYRQAGMRLHSWAIQMELAAIRAEFEREDGCAEVAVVLILVIIALIALAAVADSGSAGAIIPSCVPNCGH